MRLPSLSGVQTCHEMRGAAPMLASVKRGESGSLQAIWRVDAARRLLKADQTKQRPGSASQAAIAFAEEPTRVASISNVYASGAIRRRLEDRIRGEATRCRSAIGFL